MFFNEEIELFHTKAKDRMEAIGIAANLLLSNGIVKTSFLDNVLERENNFPTGLSTKPVGVAIPHTDSEHVNRSQIAFVSFERPVIFNDMANNEKGIPVSMIFVIAMKEKHEQAGTLANLMEMFQNEGTMGKLAVCTSKQEFKKIINESGIQ